MGKNIRASFIKRSCFCLTSIDWLYRPLIKKFYDAYTRNIRIIKIIECRMATANRHFAGTRKNSLTQALRTGNLDAKKTCGVFFRYAGKNQTNRECCITRRRTLRFDTSKKPTSDITIEMTWGETATAQAKVKQTSLIRKSLFRPHVH